MSSDLTAEKENLMALLYPSRFWWNSFNRFFLKVFLLEGYHSRNTEMKQKMAERVCSLNIVDRLPMLDDQLFKRIRKDLHSPQFRSQILKDEVQGRAKTYTQKLENGDMTLFTEMNRLFVPVALDKKVGAPFIILACSI